MHYWCASGCVVECRICNREVAGSNLSRGYFAPRSTQPSIPSGSVIEYQLRLGRQRQVWLIPIADERVGVQVKLWNPSRTRAILRWWFTTKRRYIKCMHLYLTFTDTTSAGVLSTAVGFSQRSCSAKPILAFSKVCKGAWAFYPVTQTTGHRSTLAHNVTKYWPIFKIRSSADSAVIV